MTAFLSRRDLDFQLWEVAALGQQLTWPVFEEHDRDSVTAMLDAAIDLANTQFWPNAALGDAEEPTFDGHTVFHPEPIKAAVRAYMASGFQRAGFLAEDGGLQLPATAVAALNFPFQAASIGIAGYGFLTVGAANLLRAHGSAAQIATYLPAMVEGRWFGTMCLSEPHAGSSLGDIRSRATPRGDGTYQLEGRKMWISGGENSMSENIVHMVLARLPDAPTGVKGISLFIVPKRRVLPDGGLSDSNGVRLMGLNHKMGYRATTNTALAFGDGEDCVAELVGVPHQGLKYMFHLMNEARIGVGMGAIASGTAGYRVALDYARERPQGRPLRDKNPSSPPVSITQHADVRRMLLAQKAYTEGALALGFYCAGLVDAHSHAPDAATRAEAHALLELLTPVLKAWPSDWCLEANKLAIQCLGGYGYTRDYPLERLYRDNRLNPIHEGTNGIQSLDLLGRKVLGDGGAAMRLLQARMQADCAAAPIKAQGLVHALRAAMQAVTDATAQIAQNPDPEAALAHSQAYADALGHTVIAWQWLRQARVATQALQAGASGDDAAFYQAKLLAAQYFSEAELPKVRHWAQLAANSGCLPDAVVTCGW